jgi:hypothetical protein
VETDRPGQEVSKKHRQVITHLIDNEGRAYKKPKGNGYPRLFPPKSDSSIKVPKTGHSKGHAFENWLAAIRCDGGHWPPGRKTKQEKEQEAEQEAEEAGEE